MTRLALAPDKMRPHYDAVVVGSGYGGGVAASRLARLGLKVAVLERGREILPGEFPRDLRSAQAETQLNLPSHRIGRPDALFDMRVGKGAHILMGCGLGGTSLINASVCIEPEPRVFAHAAWPEEIRKEGGLAEGYSRARAMLNPQPLPPSEKLAKLEALLAALEANPDKAHTLGRCRLGGISGRLGVFREVRGAGLPVAQVRPGERALWDNRFAVELGADENEAVIVKALGDEGFRALRERSEAISALPRLAGRTLPSCWRGEVLLGLPQLELPGPPTTFVPFCRARFVSEGGGEGARTIGRTGR